MDACPYFHEHGTKPNLIPCCKHKHAPVPCFKDNPLIERPPALRCGGRVSRCEIPANKQLDPS